MLLVTSVLVVQLLWVFLLVSVAYNCASWLTGFWRVALWVLAFSYVSLPRWAVVQQWHEAGYPAEYVTVVSFATLLSYVAYVLFVWLPFVIVSPWYR